MAGAKGVHGKGEACMVGGHAGHVGQERWPLRWMVRILLECILVFMQFLAKISPPHVWEILDPPLIWDARVA